MSDADLRYIYLSKGRYWRFRHPITGDITMPHTKGVPIGDQPYWPAFVHKYTELIARIEQVETNPVSRDRQSFSWLIRQYRGGGGQSPSEEFRALADLTQRDYERTLDLIEDELGDQPFAYATRVMIKAVRDSYALHPRKAHKIKQMVSRLYSWADENDLVPEGFNPAARIKRLKRKGGEREYVVWSSQEIELFLAGVTDHVRTPTMLALYTGQRANDIAQMKWPQWQGDIIRVRQAKTGAMLDIACHQRLKAHLTELHERSVSKKGPICRSARGNQYNANNLGSAIYRAVQSLPDMPKNRSLHGLRYAAGSTLEEAGCSVAEIEAVLGHRTFRMALKYASQRLRARAAIAKMEASA